MPTLGQKLSELIEQQRALRSATTDAREVDKIDARIEELDEQMEVLVDESWDKYKDTPEYQNV